MAATLPSVFGLQQPEDSMEISSEYGNMDADIDIDLDAPDANMHSFQDDHHMQEDPRSDRPDDDVMIDDSNQEDNDRVMQDDAPAQEQDEELLDFSDDEEDVQMNPEEPSQLDTDIRTDFEAPIEQTTTVEEPVEQVQSEIATELLTEGVQPIDGGVAQLEEPQAQVQSVDAPDVQQGVSAAQPDDSTVQQQLDAQPETSHQSHAESKSDTQEQSTVASAEDTTSTAQEAIVQSTEVPQPGNEDDANTAQEDTDADQHQQEQGNNETEAVAFHQDDKQSPHLTLTRQETDLSNYTVPEDVSRERQPNSPTVTGLHPTIVEYDGNEVYLFPSRDPAVPEQYLLDNENLVTTSLGDLLQACRAALGDGITDDEELVLGVEELDLYVSEDSTPAFSTSFSELLDIYLQLHKLDGNDHPLPFRVSLSTKTRFTNRLTSITQAISEGKGFSQLSFLQYYEYDEPTELPNDDFDDDFDETLESTEPQQIEDGAKSPEGVKAEAVPQHDDAAAEEPDSKEEDQDAEQANPSQTAEIQQGEYEGEAPAQHEEPTEVFDQSEYNQDETQYFDAHQGDVSELAGQHTAESEHAEAEAEAKAESVHGEVSAGNNDDAYDGNEDQHETAENDRETNDAGHEEFAEEQLDQAQHQGDDDAEDNFFGQGEFFDEDSYEYQDGDASHNQDEVHDAEQHGGDDGQDYVGQAEEINVTEQEQEQDKASGSIDSPKESANAEVSADVQDERKDAEQPGIDTINETAFEEDEDDDAFLDNVDGEEPATAQTTEAADDDFDEINFDDEDGYEDQDSGLAPEAIGLQSKTSPSGKRSFSELDQVDDEQDSKKARAS